MAVTVTPSPLKAAFVSRFPSLRREAHARGQERGGEPQPRLLQCVQTEIQKAVWRQRVCELAEQWRKTGVRCAWKKQPQQQLLQEGGGGGALLVLSRDCSGDTSTCGEAGGRGAGAGGGGVKTRFLVLRTLATHVEVESFAPSSSLSPTPTPTPPLPPLCPLLHFNNETLLCAYVEKWIRDC